MSLPIISSSRAELDVLFLDHPLVIGEDPLQHQVGVVAALGAQGVQLFLELLDRLDLADPVELVGDLGRPEAAEGQFGVPVRVGAGGDDQDPVENGDDAVAVVELEHLVDVVLADRGAAAAVAAVGDRAPLVPDFAVVAVVGERLDVLHRGASEIAPHPRVGHPFDVAARAPGAVEGAVGLLDPLGEGIGDEVEGVDRGAVGVVEELAEHLAGHRGAGHRVDVEFVALAPVFAPPGLRHAEPGDQAVLGGRLQLQRVVDLFLLGFELGADVGDVAFGGHRPRQHRHFRVGGEHGGQHRLDRREAHRDEHLRPEFTFPVAPDPVAAARRARRQGVLEVLVVAVERVEMDGFLHPFALKGLPGREHTTDDLVDELPVDS
jgi:hypothetical protein